jgi:hypothetical protein
MCTVLLPLGVKPIAVNKYISYIIYTIGVNIASKIIIEEEEYDWYGCYHVCYKVLFSYIKRKYNNRPSKPKFDNHLRSDFTKYFGLIRPSTGYCIYKNVEKIIMYKRENKTKKNQCSCGACTVQMDPVTCPVVFRKLNWILTSETFYVVGK